MTYNLYPAVDHLTYQFPQVVRNALAKSDELKYIVIPMSQANRNNLAGSELWNGRLVFNTTTNKINRYDSIGLTWHEIDKDVRTDPLTLPGDPTQSLHAATKGYVDNYITTYRPFSGRNRVINGDFSVNQRSFTTSTSNGVFVADRWLSIAAGTGATTTFTNVAATLGDLPESAKSFIRVASSAHSATDCIAGLVTRIESVRTLSGKTITVSFWAKASSGTPKVGVGTFQGFGTGGSPSGAVETGGGQVTISTSWQRYSITYAVPSISGKTIGNDGNDYVSFRLLTSLGSAPYPAMPQIGVQNTTIDFWGIQVEEGSVATPYEQKSYAEELQDCLRYYFKMISPDAAYNRFGWGQASGTTSVAVIIPVPVLMRAEPTPTVSSASHFCVTNSVGAAIAVTSVTHNANNSNRFSNTVGFDVGGATGLTAGNFSGFHANNTAAAYIEFSAEL